MKPKFETSEVAQFINECSPETRVYIGSDSERVLVGDKWYVDYLLCVVVHIDGNRGCRVFGYVERERDLDKNLSRPRLRLTQEAYKAAGLYLELAPLVAHDVEIHLDLNPDQTKGSSCALKDALGYVRGTCGQTPKVKPEAWAASRVSDQLKRILNDY
jgi:uncharacterized protein